MVTKGLSIGIITKFQMFPFSDNYKRPESHNFTTEHFIKIKVTES